MRKLRQRKPAQHGVHSCYSIGCHCDRCREANKIYMQKYRQLIQHRLLYLPVLKLNLKVHSDV
jgi:hypothetical protein